MTVGNARSKSKKILSRLRAIMTVHFLCRFWTFTFHDHIRCGDKPHLWHKFITALRKHYPDLEYFKVSELHKSGKIHFHALFSIYVDWHIAQRLWEKVGAGKVVHVKLLDESGARNYVSKYITKAIISLGGNCYSSSRDLCIHLADYSKWCLKVASKGLEKYLFFLLDKFDFRLYDRLVNRDKQKRMRQVWNIAVALGG